HNKIISTVFTHHQCSNTSKASGNTESPEQVTKGPGRVKPARTCPEIQVQSRHHRRTREHRGSVSSLKTTRLHSGTGELMALT
ncbi:hypothetical protein KUCAC02_021783, partial [Chaenocephalus aceratus]